MYDAIIHAQAVEFDVPVAWIKAVIQTESSWNPKAYRAEPQINDASYGLMQLLYRTARGLGYDGTPEGLYDPAINIALGAKLLGDLRVRYGDDFRRVYSAYNSGRPDLWETSSQVGTNVARALVNLEAALRAEPVLATAGAGGVILVGVLIWMWTRSTKGGK